MAKKKTKVGYIPSKKSPLKAGQWGWGGKDTADTSSLDAYKGKFEKLDTSNLMKDVKNPYANIQTQFENVFEDLTIDQRAAQFEKTMFQQSQATTLQKMQEMGMVNVQALSNAAQRQSMQSSASIGQQESANQKLRAQGASKVQDMERQAELQIAQGAWTADQAVRQGAMDARNLEYQKVQGLMSLEAGELQSQRQAKSANRNWGQRTYSDRRLKKNIVLVGKSSSGINIYNFEYKNSIYGSGVYQGVMSDDIPQKAVVKNRGKYDMVDYSKLDVDFIKI